MPDKKPFFRTKLFSGETKSRNTKTEKRKTFREKKWTNILLKLEETLNQSFNETFSSGESQLDNPFHSVRLSLIRKTWIESRFRFQKQLSSIFKKPDEMRRRVLVVVVVAVFDDADVVVVVAVSDDGDIAVVFIVIVVVSVADTAIVLVVFVAAFVAAAAVSNVGAFLSLTLPLMLLLTRQEC